MLFTQCPVSLIFSAQPLHPIMEPLWTLHTVQEGIFSHNFPIIKDFVSCTLKISGKTRF